MISMTFLLSCIIFGLIFFILILWLMYDRVLYKLYKTEDNYILLAQDKGYFSKKAKMIRDDEKVLFDILLQLFSNKYHVIPQVRLADIIDIKSGYRDHENLYLTLGQKSIDYLVVTKDSISPVVAIELQGGYHMFKNQQVRDLMKHDVLKIAGIPLIQIDKRSTYDIEVLKKLFEKYLT